ncbi:MAG: hypothetical protein J6J13_03275 [Clostridia bacterium]|nr:hypothetical protein [Clostridia bacterium]
MANSWKSDVSRYTSEIDKAIVQGSKTGMFADNNFGAKFAGTKNVIIPEITMSGMGNYVRVGNGLENEGYPKGNIATDYVTYTLNQDRSRQLVFDAMDADESGIANLAGKITGEFTRNHIIPEVDAYNLSTLFGIATEKAHTNTVDTATDAGQKKAVTSFVDMITDVEEAVGFENEDLIAFVDKKMWNLLMNTDKFTRQINVSNFKQGGVDMRVRDFNGVRLIRVDSTRMKSGYDFLDGNTIEDSGFKAKEDATSVRSLILPKSVACFVKKLDELKVFTPKENQNGNGYVIDFHMYYDLLVKKSRKGTIFALHE